MNRSWLLLLLCVQALGCASGQWSGSEGSQGRAQAPASSPARTLVAAIRAEPTAISSRGPLDTGIAQRLVKTMFNAELSMLDDRAVPRPYLVEALPQLHTDSWKVFPDGRMETTWALRPGAVWHDGTPLVAEDFVFSWRVYSMPEIGFSSSTPYSLMEEVVAVDQTTFLIRWRQPYPEAGVLAREAFPPHPRHILEISLQADQLDQFRGHPYWTRSFVGLGPFRLERWEPGAFIEGSAFARHVLGRPKVERFKLIFSGDNNATLATLLAGEVHLAGDGALSTPQVAPLRREWAARDTGRVILTYQNWRAAYFQARPDIANPRAILDPRVRRALAHGVDRQAINDAVYDGGAINALTMFPPTSMYGPPVEAAVIRYPLDLRTAEQLMQEAGFTRAGGFFTREGEGRLSLEVKTNAGVDNETEMHILSSGWRDAGFDIQEVVLPAVQAQDNEVRSVFPGLYTNSVPEGERNLPRNTTTEIARPDNRWRGANRAGWSNPEYDQLAETWSRALERDARIRYGAQMARIVSEDVPAISLLFPTQPWAHVRELQGPNDSAPESTVAWNVFQWEFR